MARREFYESEKNKWAYIVFAIMCVLILLSVFLIYYLQRTRGHTDYITLTENGVENKELDTDFGMLLPGESGEYTLHFNCQDAGEYRFIFRYEAEHVSPLAKYVVVEIKNGEETKASGNLGDLLAGTALVARLSFAEAAKADIVARYVMSDNLGDDAQGAGLDFDLRLSVEKIR
ncbi:MAG: hypothetical protein IJW60_06140 [Clostridia bacterium]|nr:hypothetical protein [Clostridia bacterium]